MWIQKEASLLFLSVFWLILVFWIGSSHASNVTADPSALETATVEGIRRFGPEARVSLITTFHDLDGNPSVQLFLVQKDQESNPEDIEKSIEAGREFREAGVALIEAGQSEAGRDLIAISKTLQRQEDHYGTLFIRMSYGESSLVAFHHGLPTYLIERAEAEERAIDFSNGMPVTLLGVLYLSPLDYFFEFEFEGKSVLVSPFHPEILSRTDLGERYERPRVMTTQEEMQGDSQSQRNLFDPPGRINDERGQLEHASDLQIVSGVPDYNQRPSLSNSCGPTAGAVLLGFWDSQGYDDFLQGEESYDDVTRLIEELSGAMGWNPAYGVYYHQVPIGLGHLIDTRGYEFSISNLYGTSSLDLVRQEINGGRPFVYGSQVNPWGIAHYVVVVGYEENFIVVHDNWPSTPTDYFVSWDALGHTDDMMVMLFPQGQAGPVSEALPSGSGGGGGGCFISASIQR
jgi:hypothetical protein